MLILIGLLEAGLSSVVKTEHGIIGYHFYFIV